MTFLISHGVQPRQVYWTACVCVKGQRTAAGIIGRKKRARFVCVCVILKWWGRWWWWWGTTTSHRRVFRVNIFVLSPRTKGKREKVHCTIIITLSLMSFEFLFFDSSSRMYHYDTHMYRLSTQCGLIQLHDNLVAWKKTDHLDCLFPWGFLYLRLKMARQESCSKKKRRTSPHPLFCRCGVSIWACGRANLKKPKKRKRCWWWSSSSFHKQNPYGGNYRRDELGPRGFCSGRPSESSSAAAAAAPPVSLFLPWPKLN